MFSSFDSDNESPLLTILFIFKLNYIISNYFYQSVESLFEIFLKHLLLFQKYLHFLGASLIIWSTKSCLFMYLIANAYYRFASSLSLNTKQIMILPSVRFKVLDEFFYRIVHRIFKSVGKLILLPELLKRVMPKFIR